ncbi:transposase [Streptomyces sp. AS58]|uniref:transposase n=1 Tax=Streptomyces sp. AS58 TaxID=1519489 RepID=UPI0006AEB50E|nr:transposase [Streptomyces sp. AS58]
MLLNAVRTRAVRRTDGTADRPEAEHLIRQEQWRDGDKGILVVLDAGYAAPRLAWLLSDPPVEGLGRLRSGRVMRRPATRTTALPPSGRIPEHGPEFRLAKSETWGDPDVATVQATERYGLARALGCVRIHPRCWHRSAWIDRSGELPVTWARCSAPRLIICPATVTRCRPVCGPPRPT